MSTSTSRSMAKCEGVSSNGGDYNLKFSAAASIHQ